MIDKTKKAIKSYDTLHTWLGLQKKISAEDLVGQKNKRDQQRERYEKSVYAIEKFDSEHGDFLRQQITNEEVSRVAARYRDYLDADKSVQQHLYKQSEKDVGHAQEAYSKKYAEEKLVARRLSDMKKSLLDYHNKKEFNDVAHIQEKAGNV